MSAAAMRDGCSTGAEGASGTVGGFARVSIVLIVGAGGLLALAILLSSLVGNPQPVPPPPQVVARQNIMVDCVWVGHAMAWEDLNGNGAQDANEPPLSQVRFEVDDVTHSKRNVTDPVTSGADGTATLREFLPGCPEVEFAVRAEPPEGFYTTTAQPVAGDGSLHFGFARKRGAHIQRPHNHRMQATAGVVAVLNGRVGRSPAAPDAER